MAAPRKKHAGDETTVDNLDKDDVDIEEENMDSSEEEESDSDMAIDEQVQVEFEARTPEDSDFHGIKLLLQQLFLKALIDLAELTNTIISQNYIGSIIKQIDVMEDDDESDASDEDSVFGLSSVINITEKKNLDCVKQITSYLIEKCQESAKIHKAGLTDILSNKQVGLVFNERFINIPPQISVPMFESLRKDIDKAVRKNMNYTFDYYLLFSKTFKSPILAGKKSPKNELMFYTNSEEEVLTELADITFSYSVLKDRDTGVEGGWKSDDGMEPFRTVFLLRADKFDVGIRKMKEAVQAMSAT